MAGAAGAAAGRGPVRSRVVNDVATSVGVTVDRWCGPLERAVLRARRRAATAAATGRVLELGGGVGEHFGDYRGAASVDVASPDPFLPVAQVRAACPVEVTVHAGSLLDAGLAAGSFDTVVTVGALATVPDLDRTLAEVARLLAPGGVVRFCEPVPGSGSSRWLGRAVRALRLPDEVARRLDRDVPRAIRRAGLTVTDIERFTMPTVLLALRCFADGIARHPGHER